MRDVFLAVGLLAMLSGQACADVTLNVTGLYNDGWGFPIVQIEYTAKGGGPTQAWVYDDPQVVAGMVDSKGNPLPFYCVDLWHDNYLPDTYQATLGPPPTFATTSAYSDAANRVAWAIESASLTGYGPAATQLLVWSIIDKDFSVFNWNGYDSGPGSLKDTYDTLVGELTDSTKGYNPKTDYLGSVMFFNAIHDTNDSLYQSLACPAPEPSSLVVASFGILALVGLSQLRRSPA
jgi:hypothetical protein